MKLRTSYFNGTILKKDITRFAPVWGLYAIILVLYLLMLPADRSVASFAYLVSDVLDGMSLLNFVYAGLCAFVLFGDLFNPRLCNALHALPLRREGWFLTHTVAGLLFCLVPNTLAAVLSMLFLQQYSYMAFLWLAVMVLQFLFFFGVGAFSAVCAGNRLGMLAIYTILNFLSYILLVFVHSFFIPFLFGLELNTEPFTKYCPSFQLLDWGYVDVYYDYMPEYLDWRGIDPESWTYTYIIAGLGVILLGLSVFIYRRRKLESAGDFISLRPVAPIFLVIYALGVGVVLYELASTIYGAPAYFFLLIGLAIGFFTGRMLLERKVNVFKPKAFLGFGVLVGALAISMAITWLDPTGITRYVPEVDDIQSIQLYDSDIYGSYRAQEQTFTLTDAEDLEAITAIHESLVAKRDGSGSLDLHLIYELKDGSTVKRSYPVDINSQEGAVLLDYFSSWQYIFATDDWNWLEENTYEIMIDSYTENFSIVIGSDSLLESYVGEYYTKITLDESNEHIVPELLEAIRKDCDAGGMAQTWAYRQDREGYGWIHLTIGDGHNDRYQDIHIFEDSVNTLAVIERLHQQASE